MLITVSGPPGAGKSTAASGLAAAFDVDHVSGGDIFRDIAAEREMTPLEFNRLAEEDESIDRDLDERLRQTAAGSEDLVLESRLAGWLAADHADFRLWLDAPLAVRARRIAAREDRPLATTKTEERERQESETRRYHEYYGIDVRDLSIYDLSLNTARWSEADMVEIPRAAIERYDPEDDEGKQPVDVVFPFD